MQDSQDSESTRSDWTTHTTTAVLRDRLRWQIMQRQQAKLRQMQRDDEEIIETPPADLPPLVPIDYDAPAPVDDYDAPWASAHLIFTDGASAAQSPIDLTKSMGDTPIHFQHCFSHTVDQMVKQLQRRWPSMLTT